MNANVVLEIVKMLSIEEQGNLLLKLKTTLEKDSYSKPKKKRLITRAEADIFIFERVFSKK